MSDNKIHIIGLGVAENAELTPSASDALQQARVIIGSERQLATVKSVLSNHDYHFIPLPKLSELACLLQQHTREFTVILASGDPLYYGIGRWLSDNVDKSRLVFYPAVSSLQVVCHRLRIALQDVHVVSLHGRPLVSLRPYLRQQRRLLLLTDDNSLPHHLAYECIHAGFEQSSITVCEKLGYQEERIQRFDVSELINSDHYFDPLHITYIELQGDGGVFPEFPGIPDHYFATGDIPGKGMITKREVRLSILSLLQACKHDVIWDIGAGCGGVSIELSLWQPAANIYAIEHHDQRLSYLRHNQKKFGVVKNLHVVEGRAPEILDQLPLPTKVFIGGSDGELSNLLLLIWPLLPLSGILVVSSVTESTRQQLHQFSRTLLPHQVESIEIGVKRGHLEQDALQYTAKLPVEIFIFTKRESHSS